MCSSTECNYKYVTSWYTECPILNERREYLAKLTSYYEENRLKQGESSFSNNSLDLEINFEGDVRAKVTFFTIKTTIFNTEFEKNGKL